MPPRAGTSTPPLLAAWLQAATADLLDTAGITPGASVLDLAAGAGEQTLDIARRVGPGGQVLATDISPAILALASARFQHAGLGWVQTRVLDAQALGQITGPVSDEPDAGFDAQLVQPFAPPFDAVVCRLGLMLCPQPQAVLTGALATLRPGGRFAALVFGAAQDNPCITTLVSTALRHAGLPSAAPAASAAQPSPPGTLLSLGQPGLLAGLLAAAGFAQVTVRSINAPMRLPSAQHYIDFVRTAGGPVMAILAPLSADAQRDAWFDIAQQLARFNTADGWVGPNALLLCAGTRPPLATVELGQAA